MIGIIPIEKGIDYEKDFIGNKAYWLSVLCKNNINIPDGYILLKEVFEEFLSSNHIVIERRESNKIFHYDQTREKIFNGIFSPGIISSLKECFEKLAKPIIVRSSAGIEDSSFSSCAGLFQSIGEINTFDKLLEAVKLCWISSFSDLIDIVIGFQWDHGLCLVLQEQKIPDYGGVAFTIDPVTNDRTKLLIELSEEGCKAVVSGYGDILSFSIDRSGGIPHSDYSEILLELREQLLKIEGILNLSIDVEWLINEKELYIIQARPVTTGKKIEFKKIIAVDDVCVHLYNLENCTCMHSRWLEKKIPVRKFCIEKDISIGKFFYYFKRGTAIPGDEAEILNFFSSSMVEINDSKTVMLVKKDQLLYTLNHEFQESPVVRIGESVPTVFCGFSAIVGENIYIEAIMGGFPGFYEGGFVPTTYLVDSNLNIIKENIGEFNEEYILNDSYWEKREISPILLKLDILHIKKIMSMTYALSHRFGEVRVEWIANSNGIYLFDLSVEKEKISSIDSRGLVLSSGYCEGYAKIVDNINLFDDYVTDISIRMGHEFTKLNNSEAIRNIKKELALFDNDIIIVCKYPKETLAVLVDCVKGFIFERGSILCHLSIILREKKIPALIYPDAMKKIKDGTAIIMDNSEIVLQ